MNTTTITQLINKQKTNKNRKLTRSRNSSVTLETITTDSTLTLTVSSDNFIILFTEAFGNLRLFSAPPPPPLPRVVLSISTEVMDDIYIDL